MDTQFISEIKERMHYERSRSAPPPGFPALPDLPLSRYTDQGFFQLELDHVFRRRWLFIGHDSEWAQPGSYRVLDLPFAPVVVVRGSDGQLRAFLNACRHRGAPVVRETCGTAKHLVCGFHSWSYDLTGRLVGVPDQRDFVDLDLEQRGLTPVRCETWGGFVFINLDADAVPLRQDLKPLVERYSDLMSAGFRFVESRSWDLDCNWKVAVEAFLEVYHFRTVHANSAAPVADPRGAVMVLHDHGHSSMFLPYKPDILTKTPELRELFFPSDVPTVDVGDGFYQEANPSFLAFPNMITPTDVSGFFILTYWPLAVNRTRMDLHWFGVDWGQGDRPAGWDLKLTSWDMLMNEDVLNLEPIQRSIESAAHQGIPLNYQERRIWQFHADLDDDIGAHNIPDELRVHNLLGHYREP